MGTLPRRLAATVGCAACCALPMLVIAGALSVGAVMLGGLSATSVLAVIWMSVAAARGRLHPPPLPVRLVIAGSGAGVAMVGFMLSGRWASSFITVSVALLAAAALLALTAARPPADQAAPAA